MDYEVTLERVDGSFGIDLTTLDEVGGARVLVSAVGGQSPSHRQVMAGDEVLAVAGVDVTSRGLEGVASALAEIVRLEELSGTTSFTWKLRRSQPTMDAAHVAPWPASSAAADRDFLEMESLASEQALPHATLQDSDASVDVGGTATKSKATELELEPALACSKPEPEPEPAHARESSANAKMYGAPRGQGADDNIAATAVSVRVSEAAQLGRQLLSCVSAISLTTTTEPPASVQVLHDVCAQLTPLLKRLLQLSEQHELADESKAAATGGLAENMQNGTGSRQSERRPRLTKQTCEQPGVVLTLSTARSSSQVRERRQGQGREVLRLTGKAGVERILGRGLHGLPVDPKLPREHIRLFFNCNSDKHVSFSSPPSSNLHEAPGWAAQTLGKTAALVERTTSNSGIEDKQQLPVPLAPAFLMLQNGDVLYHRRVRPTVKAERSGKEAGVQSFLWEFPMAVAVIERLSEHDDDTGLSNVGRQAAASVPSVSDAQPLASTARTAVATPERLDTQETAIKADASAAALSVAEPAELTERLRKLQEARRRLEQHQRLNKAQSASKGGPIATGDAAGCSGDAESNCSVSAGGNAMPGTELTAAKATATATDKTSQSRRSFRVARSAGEKRGSSTRRVRSVRAGRAATQPRQEVADVAAGKQEL